MAATAGVATPLLRDAEPRQPARARRIKSIVPLGLLASSAIFVYMTTSLRVSPSAKPAALVAEHTASSWAGEDANEVSEVLELLSSGSKTQQRLKRWRSLDVI